MDLGERELLMLAFWIGIVAALLGPHVLILVRKLRPKPLTDSQVEHELRLREGKKELAEAVEKSKDGEIDPNRINWSTMPVSPTGAIAARASKEPLHDREIVAVGCSSMSFFQNFVSFWEGGPKTPGVDTNMHGSGGSLPNGYHAKLDGITLVIDDAGANHDTLLRWLKSDAALEIDVGGTRWRTIPVASALAEKCTDKAAYSFGMLLELQPLEWFRVKLITKTPSPVRFSAHVFLHGTVLRPICV